MKVIDRRQETKFVPLGSLKPGDGFVYRDEVCVVVNDSVYRETIESIWERGYVRVIHLDRNMLNGLGPELKVEPVNLRVEVE